MKRQPQVELEAGETIVVPPRKAVHTDRGRKAGGRLLITTSRLIFNANFLDSWFFSSVAIELTEISNVDVASRSYKAYDGGLARRLDVHLRDGSEHLFVLASGGVDSYAENLSAHVKRAADGWGTSTAGDQWPPAVAGRLVAVALVRRARPRKEAIACRPSGGSLS